MSNLILGCVITFTAGFIQGVTGFGLALIAVPLLSSLLPLERIVPLVVLYSLITNLYILNETKSQIRLKEIQTLIVFGIIGIPAGVSVLKIINPDILKLFMGMIIMVTAITMLQGFKVEIKNQKVSSGVIGFLSGFLNGSISMSGPPVVIFLTNQGIEKDVFRANLTAYAFITNIITIASFGISGGLDRTVMQQFLYLLPGLVLGLVIGVGVARKINEMVFKKLILLLISVMGLTTFITTLCKLVSF